MYHKETKYIIISYISKNTLVCDESKACLRLSGNLLEYSIPNNPRDQLADLTADIIPTAYKSKPSAFPQLWQHTGAWQRQSFGTAVLETMRNNKCSVSFIVEALRRCPNMENMKTKGIYFGND